MQRYWPAGVIVVIAVVVLVLLGRAGEALLAQGAVALVAVVALVLSFVQASAMGKEEKLRAERQRAQRRLREAAGAQEPLASREGGGAQGADRKSTRLNSSHG